eukprot:NODE_97_length_21155_cov_0.234850.p9 type:complete len:244 gc:universal NODE_97_length_21155_cov_0.234850:12645-13376(+)
MTQVPQNFPELVINPYQKKYDIWKLVKNTNVIIQQISIVFLTLALYMTLFYNLIPVRILMCIGIVLFIITSPTRILSAILLLNFLAGISPILKTLAKSISTDSIYHLAGLLYFLNLLLKSYSVRNNTLLKDGMAMNAGYCASVLLASRLENLEQVFTLLMLSVCLLCYIPYLTSTIHNQLINKITTTLLLSMALFSWVYLNENMAWLLIGIVVCISVISPLLFLHLQKYKNVLSGPWDEPKIS